MQHPLVKYVLTQMQLSGNIPHLSASMDVEFNKIPFHLDARDGKAILKFDKWSEAFDFFMKMKKFASGSPSFMSDIRHVLHAIGLTIYLQNSKLAVLGPQAGRILPGLLSLTGRFRSKHR